MVEEKKIPVDFFNRPPATEKKPDFHSAMPARPTEPKEKKQTTTRILESLVSISFIAIFFGVPVFFLGATYQGLAFEKQLYFYFWLLLGLISWSIKGIIVGEMKIRRTPLDIFIIVFWVAYLFSSIFSVDRWHSFWGLWGDPSRGFMNVTALFVFYYLFLSNFTWRRMHQAIGALLVATFFSVTIASLAIMKINFIPNALAAYVPLSMLGSSSSLMSFVSIMIPVMLLAVLALSDQEKEKSTSKSVALYLVLFLIMVSLFLLLALWGFVFWWAIGIGTGFFAIFIISRSIQPSSRWIWVPLGTIVLILAMMLIKGLNISRLELPLEVRPNIQTSFQIAKESIKDNPVLGSGPATYGYVFSLHKPQEFNLDPLYNLRFYQGTGFLFEAIPTIGLIGTIALVLLICSYIGIVGYLLFKDSLKKKIYSLGLISAFITFLIIFSLSRVEGPLLSVGIMVSVLALAAALKESSAQDNLLNFSLKASPKFALSLAFIFMVISAGVVYLFVFMGKVLAADIIAGRSIVQQQVTEAGSIDKMRRAISLYGLEAQYYFQLSQQYMQLVNQEMASDEKEKNIQIIQSYLTNSVAFSNAGKDLMPKNVLAWETLGQIYEIATTYDTEAINQSTESYQKALELEPHNPVYFSKIAQLKIMEARTKQTEEEAKALYQEAKDWSQKSLDEKENYDNAYYQMSLAQEGLGEIDGSIENMTKAFALNRSSITYAFNLGRLYQARGNDEDNKGAEILYKQIIELNDKDMNVHFYLGRLYDETDRRSQAKDEYKKVLVLLPDNETFKPIREKIEKMISNIDRGIENTPENLNIETIDENQESTSNPNQPAQNPVRPAAPSREDNP